MIANKDRPGCRDVFHAFLVDEAEYAGDIEIPVLNRVNAVPNKVTTFTRALKTNDFNQWVCFYEDDHNFEKLWNNPRKYLSRLKKFKGVILPDFSLYLF